MGTLFNATETNTSRCRSLRRSSMATRRACSNSCCSNVSSGPAMASSGGDHPSRSSGSSRRVPARLLTAAEVSNIANFEAHVTNRLSPRNSPRWASTATTASSAISLARSSMLSPPSCAQAAARRRWKRAARTSTAWSRRTASSHAGPSVAKASSHARDSGSSAARAASTASRPAPTPSPPSLTDSTVPLPCRALRSLGRSRFSPTSAMSTSRARLPGFSVGGRRRKPFQPSPAET